MINLSAEEIERRINILKTQTFYLGPSYYPEKKSKSDQERFNDLVEQIKTYGWPDFQYLQYGMDVKTPEECAKYVNAMEFVYRRNYLNFESKSFDTECCILRNKLFFDIFAKGIGIKTPTIEYFYTENVLYDMHDGFKPFSFSELVKMEKSYFCKDLNGECGNGIFILIVKEGQFVIDDKIVSEEDLLAIITGKQYIFQTMLVQHAEMSRLYPNSINSIRLVTVRSMKDNKIHVLPSILRMGANGSFVDNTSQGGIACGFDILTGQLNETGLYKPQFGRLTSEHPNSKVRFSEFKIPFIDKAISQATFFHSMLKNIHSIGWDIAIGPEDPIFIEGNDDWEITGPQSCNRGLRKEFEEYFFE